MGQNVVEICVQIRCAISFVGHYVVEIVVKIKCAIFCGTKCYRNVCHDQVRHIFLGQNVVEIFVKIECTIFCEIKCC